jgi:hypothetical protein
MGRKCRRCFRYSRHFGNAQIPTCPTAVKRNLLARLRHKEVRRPRLKYAGQACISQSTDLIRVTSRGSNRQVVVGHPQQGKPGVTLPSVLGVGRQC